jgi:hypothetical protein
MDFIGEPEAGGGRGRISWRYKGCQATRLEAILLGFSRKNLLNFTARVGLRFDEPDRFLFVISAICRK